MKLFRTQNSLEDMCREFLIKEYGVSLTIPVKINNRLSRTLGRFVISAGGINNRIEFAGRLLKYGTDKQVISVLKHECIHYALYELKRDFKDGQKDFENELIKHNSDSTNMITIKGKKENQIVLDEHLFDDILSTVTNTINNVFDEFFQNEK